MYIYKERERERERQELLIFLLLVIKFLWERESNTYKFPELMYAFITTDKSGSMEMTNFSNKPLEINSKGLIKSKPENVYWISQ